MHTRTFARGRVLAGLAFTLAGSVYGGIITAIPTVTPNGSLFHYNYSVTNATGLDLAVLDIVVQKGAGTIQNLAAPTGFVSAYDSVLGLVSFLEDSKVFGATTITGFVFDSPFSARATTFNGTLLDANFNVSTQSGATQGPLPGPVVPEPSYFPVLASFLALAAVTHKLRRNPAVGKIQL